MAVNNQTLVCSCFSALNNTHDKVGNLTRTGTQEALLLLCLTQDAQWAIKISNSRPDTPVKMTA